MGLYKKTEKFVIEAFEKAGKPTDIHHAKRTAYWVKFLKPDADEALLIAGAAHDIERAFFTETKKFGEPSSLRKHQDQSAAEIEKFLRNENVDERLIEKIKYLVAHHEEGGDEDQNILSDADCLAYFEEKAMRHILEHKAKNKSLEELKKIIENNFQRIYSGKAKKIARKWYNEAIEEIEKVK